MARIVFTGGASLAIPGQSAEELRDTIQKLGAEGKWLWGGGNRWINPGAIAYVDDLPETPTSPVMEGIPGALK